MLGTIRSIARRLTRQEVRECRRCGTNVNDPGTDCPTCGSREVARYEL